MYARAMSTPPPRSPRLREHGLRIGRFETGPANAITDVTGVAVGHVTVWRDEPDAPEGRGVARTGVTAVLPAPVGTIFAEPVPAGMAVLNGAGELTGSLTIAEWGLLETPVYLTSTHAVGRVYDGAVNVAVEAANEQGMGVEGSTLFQAPAPSPLISSHHALSPRWRATWTTAMPEAASRAVPEMVGIEL
jgi:L-aminopeptidase/D-esterase-like protein